MARKVISKLYNLIDKYNVSMRKLSRISDVRPEALNELANHQRGNITFGHIERIAESLHINDIREIITLEEDKDDD
ncbi:helix-turn-helix domain-containing protein [Neobacillus vireti]|uniref:helix-turn-helix domain-containing protein n=1 Tax=Neobacillus vireti TaxID=220686 RepID=UPI002FFD7114